MINALDGRPCNTTAPRSTDKGLGDVLGWRRVVAKVPITRNYAFSRRRKTVVSKSANQMYAAGQQIWPACDLWHLHVRDCIESFRIAPSIDIVYSFMIVT